MQNKTEPKLIAGFVLVFVVIIINAIVSASNMNAVSRNRLAVVQSNEVVLELEAVLSTVKDAETGQRGYIITDDDLYLVPYNDALTTIHNLMANLHRLVAGNEEQVQRIADLNGLISAKFAELQSTVQLRKHSGGAAAAEQVVKSGSGKRTMDAIRALVGHMEETEKRLLYFRQQDSIASEQKTRITFAAITIAALILLVIVYLLVMHSIQQRQQFADDLQKREEWLSTTLRSIGDAVIATDAQGRITFLNPVAESLTGWTSDDAVGQISRSVFNIVNEDTRLKVEDPIDRVIAEGVVVELANHTVLLTKDGREVPIDDSGAPIRDTLGRLIGVVLVFRDITERKVAQHQRELYFSELEMLNSRLKTAMTETHHRVKNNLQLIAAMIEVQTQEGLGTLSADEVIRLETNIRTLAAVQDILTYESKTTGDISEVSTKGILELLLPIHQDSAPRYHITAQLEEVRLPGKQGTALALLANELLSNAIKHGKSVVQLALETNFDKSMLEMRVADDGPGFPGGFDPVTAAHTGLELVVSLATCDLGAELLFGNHVDGGGEVTLRIPLSAQGTSEPMERKRGP